MPYRFNGKELDEETGLYYYGARYMQPITSVWYGVDPLTEKYPEISGYVYCHGNPIKYVDVDGKDDYYNLNGKQIGTNGVNNDIKMVITDKKEAKQISKIKGVVNIDNLKSAVRLPSNATLQESINTLERTVANGGLREESALVMKDKTSIIGETGPLPIIVNGVQTATTYLPKIPHGKSYEDVEATIHSHPTTIQQVDNQIFPQSASNPSPMDIETFKHYNINIIVGPIGPITSVTSNPDGSINIPNRANGIVIYDKNAVNKIELTKDAILKILKK